MIPIHLKAPLAPHVYLLSVLWTGCKTPTEVSYGPVQPPPECLYIDCPSWLRPKWADHYAGIVLDRGEAGLLIDVSAPFLNKTQVKQLIVDGRTFPAVPSHE